MTASRVVQSQRDPGWHAESAGRCGVQPIVLIGILAPLSETWVAGHPDAMDLSCLEEMWQSMQRQYAFPPRTSLVLAGNAQLPKCLCNNPWHVNGSELSPDRVYVQSGSKPV